VRDVTTGDKELWRQDALARRSPPYIEAESLKRLERLVKEFSRSPYRPYALRLLTAPVIGATTEAPSNEATSKHAAYLQELMEKYPNFAWRDHRAVQRYQVLMNLGEVERARQSIQFLKDDPWAPPQLKYEAAHYEPPVLFATDTRLNQEIIFESQQQTPLKEVLEELTRQTGVPLSVHPDLERRSLKSLRLTKTLQQVMKFLSVYKAEWIRDGDGYRLIPKAE